MNKSDLLNKLAEFKKINGEKYSILSIGIFGSFARDQASGGLEADR